MENSAGDTDVCLRPMILRRASDADVVPGQDQDNGSGHLRLLLLMTRARTVVVRMYGERYARRIGGSYSGGIITDLSLVHEPLCP